MAEKLCRDYKTQDIDPDVVESACLAHDLGHPPFGHLAEEELNRLAITHGLPDGFEGNAQSFRIVTRLAMGSAADGLNLTRATLNALLKYPWLRDQRPGTTHKFGAYNDDRTMFEWARKVSPGAGIACIESQLMDWADDVTYSVHDADDFYRAGVLPLDRLTSDPTERRRFFKAVFASRANLPRDMDETYLRGAFDQLIDKLPFTKPFEASRRERMNLRNVTGTLIHQFLHAVTISGNPPAVVREKLSEAEVFMLKQLTWHYVIKCPALATQQHGQRRIINDLFDAYFTAATAQNPRIEIFPISARELLPPDPAKDRPQAVRVIIDFIASLTEEQAVATHRRLCGIALGNSLSHSVR